MKCTCITFDNGQSAFKSYSDNISITYGNLSFS